MAETNTPAPPPGFSPVTQQAPAVEPVAPPPAGFAPVQPSETEGGGIIQTAGEFALNRIDNVTQIGQGIITGATSLAQGLAELPAIGFDLAFDTNTAESVTNFFEPIVDFIEPESGLGQITADITSFGIGFLPIAGWLGRAGQVARGVRATTQAAKGSGALSTFMRTADQFGSSAAGKALLSSRAGMIGTTALAAGTYDAMVTPDGRATLSDQFSVMPDFLRTEADTGLTGRDEALRRLRNRGRAGIEGAALSGVTDVALAGAGAAARQVARVPQVAAAANAFSDALANTGSRIATRFPKATELATRYLTPSGGANRILYEETEDARAVLNDAKQRAVTAADEYSQEFQGVMKALDIQGPTQAKIIQDEVSQYLEGIRWDLPSITDAKLQKRVTEKLDRMISISNQNTDRLMATLEATAKSAEEGTPRQLMAAEAVQVLRQTRNAEGTHLRRVFEQYRNPVKFYKNLDLTSPVAKKAQREVAENIAAMEGRLATDPEVMERAKDVVLRTLDLGSAATTKGLSEKQIVDLRLTAAREATEGTGRLGSLISKERPEFTTDKTLFTQQEEILAKSPSLRELKGEVTDPIQRYIQTIEDTVRTEIASRFYNNLPRLNLEKPLFEAVEDLNAGKRPPVVSVPDLKSMNDVEYMNAMSQFGRMANELNVSQARLPAALDTTGRPGSARPSVDRITSDDLVEQYKQRLRAEGYVQLGEAAADDVFGGIYGAASGKFVSPETYRAITQPLRLSQNIASEALAALSTFRNITQKMTIVPNPASQVRNIIGNVGFLAGNANLPNGGDITDLLYTFLKSTKDLDEAGLTRLTRKLTLAGVRDVNLVTRALKEYRGAAEDLTFNGKLTQALDKAEGIIPFMRQFENLYSNSDTFFKGAALLAEESKFLSALNRAAPGFSESDPALLQALFDNGLIARGASMIAPGLTPLELMASEIVKDTMPTYSRVVKAVKMTDAVPIIGNFTSFAAENIRNSVGTVSRGIKELSFEAGPALRARIGDQAANALETQIRALGAQRLGAYTSMAYVLPKTMVHLAMAATGTTPDQMAALYEMNPDFLDGHDLVVLENNRSKGYIDFIDLSYVMPYAFMTDPAKAALRQYAENGRAEKNMVSSVMDSMFAGFKVFADPFASETMFYERLRDVMPTSMLFGRGGVSATGARIYGENEDPMSVAQKSFNHLVAGFAPAYVGLITEERSGTFQQGRLLRAYTGVPDKQGEVTNPATEIARLVTGFTPMRLNLRQDARYKGSEYIPLRSDSRSRVNATIRRADVTADDVVGAWDQYLGELHRAQSKLYRDVEAMRTLGMTDDQIRYSLINQAGLGRAEANGIIDGRFTPSAPSEELAADIRAQLNLEGRTRLLEDIPWGDLIRMTEERNNEPLRSADEQRLTIVPEQGPRPAPPLPPGFVPVPSEQGPRPAPPLPPGFVPVPSAGFTPFNEGALSLPPIPQIAPSLVPAAAPVQAPVQATRTANLSPSLLGGTLAEQAANTEIAQRLG